jgi:hypothetical protein
VDSVEKLKIDEEAAENSRKKEVIQMNRIVW